MTHPAEQLYQSNLAYLKREFPYLHDLALKTEMRKATLSITPNGKADIHSGNAYFYNGDAEEYAEQEVGKFFEKVHYKSEFKGLPPHGYGVYTAKRLFSLSMDNLYKDVDYSQDNLYQLPKFMPLLVVTGIGSGLHIKKLLERCDVMSLVIYEVDPEEFLISLYLIDWKPIIDKFSQKGRSIDIMVKDFKHAQHQYAALWNCLIDKAPNFALCTFFYNHRLQSRYTSVIKKIQSDMKVYLNLWGYYDDEINQFNNALHNLNNDRNILGKRPKSTIKSPIFIVGSGPSLDQRIETIKKYKDKAIIVSAGTALLSLYKHGITPDFHVEIESHYESYVVINQINDEDFLNKITLIGAIQLTPKISNLFKESILFVKDSTAIYELTKQITDRCKGTTPTCTNTALGLATYFLSENMFLFGTDYGFRDKSNHHSKHSIYYSEEKSELIEESNRDRHKNLIDIESVDGDLIQTTTMYNASKRRIESDLKTFSKEYPFKIYNCANGAKIEGADHIKESESWDIIDNIISNKTNDLDSIKSNKSIANKSTVNSEVKTIHSNLVKITSDITGFISSNKSSLLLDHFKDLNTIGSYLTFGLKDYGTLYFMVRGAIWHYLHAGASVALKLQNDESKMAEFITKWELSFKRFLKLVPEHFKAVTYKQYDDKDPWIHTQLFDEECPEYIDITEFENV